MRPIKLIVVHHAARSTATLETITHTHKARGFKGVGYHVVIERGARMAGRDPRRPGAHTQGLNANTLAVCIADDCNKRLRPEDWEALVSQCVDWCAHFKLPASAVIGHRETPLYGGAPTKKQCPGKLVDLSRLRAEVAARLAAGERVA
jgi:N-acetylmuramoyl-L-alanine amidase